MNDLPLDDPTIPSCVRYVRDAAKRLRATIEQTAFPSLAEPESDQEAVQRVDAARDWWNALFKVHGGIVGTAPVDRNHYSRPPETRSLLWHFDPYFQGTDPRSPLNPRIEDVLGELPRSLRVLPSPFFSMVVLFPARDRLPNASGLNHVVVSRENWIEVRGILDLGRQLVERHCAALLDWLWSRIESVTQPTVPTIRVTGPAERGNVVVAVTHNGRRRTAQLTRTELGALKQLKARGIVAMDRGKKAGLVRKLPELEPHLSATDEIRLTRDTASSEYRLSDAARFRLDLGEA